MANKILINPGRSFSSLPCLKRNRQMSAVFPDRRTLLRLVLGTAAVSAFG
jgi:hypothetical protein